MQMNKTLMLILILLLLPLASAVPSRIYIITLNYNHGRVSLIDASTDYGYAPGRQLQPEQGYYLKTASFDGKTLDQLTFEFPTTVFYDYVEGNETKGGVVSLDNVNQTLILPYFRTAQFVMVYDRNYSLLLKIDVSKYSECNLNSKCDKNENFNTCPEDCKASTTKLPVPQPEPETPGEETGISLFYFLIPAAILFLAAAAFFYYKRQVK